MKVNSLAVPYVPSCRACDAGVERRGILAFKRTANLCAHHQTIWNEENEKDLKRTERGQAVTGGER